MHILSIKKKSVIRQEDILTPEALKFIQELEVRFGKRRLDLLLLREKQKKQIAINFEYSEETRNIRENLNWKVASIPKDLLDRRVEITGPPEGKMLINALNSGASAYMADLEDSTAPTWENVITGQQNLKEAVRGTLKISGDGKEYKLNEKRATLLVRPRGWHLDEAHVELFERPISASLFDFGLFFFHNAKELIRLGSGPYFYLPKLESYLEARLWNDVFIFSQDYLGIARGTIRATVLVETLPAALQMEEILFELKEHSAGLNAGRWDYLFSAIKTFSDINNVVFPDREELTMTLPFMLAYAKKIVAVCHKRGAHAIGGMSAFIPSRKDQEVNERALIKVRADKEREFSFGFDGTWVAHPDLVAVAKRVFTDKFGEDKNQLNILRSEWLEITADELKPHFTTPIVTEQGVRNNISVSLQYMSAWLSGRGAVGINNLMEDAATAEISRSQLWQWVTVGINLKNGPKLTPELFKTLLIEETLILLNKSLEPEKIKAAATLIENLVLEPRFLTFLTLNAYLRLI